MLTFARGRVAAFTEATLIALIVTLIAGIVGWRVVGSLAATTYRTPEGATIVIDSAGPWTYDQIHRMLVENGLDSTIGHTLTVKVQDVFASQTTASASASGGVYQNYGAIIYLKGIDSTFAIAPDAVLGHEFGHAWTMYDLFLTQNNDWAAYLSFRGLLGDPRVDSTYNWSKNEMIADDYRLVMGSALAKSEMPGYINTDVPPPSAFPGFRDFFISTWAGGAAAPTTSPTPTVAPTTSPPPLPSPSPSPSGTATVSPTPAPTASPSPSPTVSSSATPAVSDLVTNLAASPQLVRKSTQISFGILATANVTVQILDAGGGLIRTISTGTLPPSTASLGWNRTDDQGRRVPKGSYWLSVESSAGTINDVDTLLLTAQ
jgi:hypothetical protein